MTRFLLDSNAVLSATSGSDEEVLFDLNQSAALEPAIVSIAGPMINSANDLQGVQKMAKKVANVQLLLPAKIVDIEAKILLRTDLRSSNPQYVSVQLLRSMMVDVIKSSLFSASIVLISETIVASTLLMLDVFFSLLQYLFMTIYIVLQEVFKDSERRCLELYESIGLSDAREAVGSMQLFGGHGRNSRGKSFEAVAADVVRSHLIPDVAHKRGIDKHSVFAVRNVKLGMASSKGSTAEFDCLLCVKDKRPDRLENIKQKGIFCKVIAVVEVSFLSATASGRDYLSTYCAYSAVPLAPHLPIQVKRNADDMGEAFMGYQSSLNWLTGSEVQ